MSEAYIRANFEDIKKYENVIENRLDDDFTIEDAINGNAEILKAAKEHNVNYILIDDKYAIDIEL